MASTEKSAQLRRTLLQMVLWVAVLHGTAIGVYYLAGVSDAPSRVRSVFTVVWLAATFAAVSVFLRKIRVLRRGGAPRR